MTRRRNILGEKKLMQLMSEAREKMKSQPPVFQSNGPCLSKNRFKFSRDLPDQNFLVNREIFDEFLQREVYVESEGCPQVKDSIRRKIFNLDKIDCYYHRAREMGQFIEEVAAIGEDYVDWLHEVIEDANSLREIHIKYLLGETKEALSKERWTAFSDAFMDKNAHFSAALQRLCSRNMAYKDDLDRALCRSVERDRSMECKSGERDSPERNGEEFHQWQCEDNDSPDIEPEEMVCFNLCGGVCNIYDSIKKN